MGDEYTELATRNKLPSAKEMAVKTRNILEAKTQIILSKIETALDKSTTYNVTISLSEEEEKSISGVLDVLRELGYETDYSKGYYEDRPCGGHVSGKLTIDWSRAK